MHKLHLDDRVFHRRRQEYGSYAGLTATMDTVWVRFDGRDEFEKVDRGLLAKVAE